MDKHQELQTNLVLRADEALSSIRELSGRLNQISHIKFDNVKQGFTTLTKAFEAAQKMSSKVAKVQTEDEKELQNLLQKRAKIMAEMMKEFSNKKTGLSVKVDMSEAQKELQKTTRMVADMYLAMGQTGKARSAMKDALSMLTSLEKAGFRNTGIKSLEREMTALERHIQDLDAKAKKLKEKARAGRIEEIRQQALREKKDPLSIPEYANSPEGKADKRRREAQAKAEAEAHAKDQKAIRDTVLSNIKASQAVRQAKDEAHQRSIKQSEARIEQAKKEGNALQEHLRKMQNQPSSSDTLNKMLGVNENVINTPENKKRRKKQIEKAEKLTSNGDEANREKALQYEQRVRRELARKQAQAEEKAQREAIKRAEDEAKAREKALQYEQRVRSAIARKDQQEANRLAREQEKVQQEAIRNAKKLADEREKALRYEQQVRSAIAKADYQAQQRQARLDEKQAENLKKLQDKVDAFQRRINHEKRPGNTVSENQMFRLKEDLIKLQKMAEGIGAGDIRKKLTTSMLDGINVLTQAQKKASQEAKASASEEIKLQEKRKKVIEDIVKLYKDIEAHKGRNGLGYSVAGYNNAVNRIENLRNRALDTGLHGDAVLLNPALLNGVNTKLSQFNTRLNEAKDKAQQLYMEFRETRSEADRLNFLKAKNDLRALERLAEDFDKSIQKSSRSALNLQNVLKRAREHFNWTAGAYVENALVSIPTTLVSDVTKYELAMAGVAQVLPKAEEGQHALNEQFKAFADTASLYGQSVDNVLESAKSIGRMYGQGDGDSDVGATNTQLLTAQAAKMATVDNFDMIQATKGLESALAQFNLQTEDTNLLMQRSGHILDVWTKLAHSSGASAQDLTEGVNKAGSAAHNAGVSFEMLNALIASGVRNTAESGNIIGNALKSMFSSILSDKNIKNMERYGVQIYKIGKNGKQELREMQDIIMDISRLLANPSMDTKGLREFMMTISGGKQQYSRIEAILGHPEELERTLRLAQNSTGFANKQLEIQMDTVARKWEALKANVAQMFVNSGADGFANDLKWILDCLNRLTHSLANSSNHIYKWAKYGTMMVIAWKAIPSLINMATRALARYNIAKEVGSTPKAMSAGLLGGVRTDYQAEIDRQKKKRLERAGVDISQIKDVETLNVAWNQYTESVKRNSLAHRANNAIVNLSTNNAKAKVLSMISPMNLYTGATKKAGNVLKGIKGSFSSTVASIANFGRNMTVARGVTMGLTTAVGLCSGALGVLRGVVAFLGGPIGIAVTLFGLLGTYLTSQAIDADMAKTSYEDLSRSVQDLTTEMGYEAEQMAEQKEKAEELAEEYNGLVDKQNELKEKYGEGVTQVQEYIDNEQRMGEIKKEVSSIFHNASIQLDEDGKINMNTINALAEAEHEEAMQKLDETQAKVSAEVWATSEAIKSSKARIAALEAEKNETTVASAAYRALYHVITGVKMAINGLWSMAKGVLDGGITGYILDNTFGKHVVDGWREAVSKSIEEGEAEIRSRVQDLDDGSNLLIKHDLSEEYQNLEALEKEYDSKNDDWNSLEAIRLGKSYDRKNHEYVDRKKINTTTENPNEDRWHPKSLADERAEAKAAKDAERAAKKAEREAKKAEREANKKRPYIYDDEQSKSFSTASKHINQSYSSMGVDMATMQAIASALNGGNFVGVNDPFHNGASNTWDSSYNFAEQLKTQFQSGESLKTALENIFNGWGIVWDDVIQEEADALRKKFNYKENERLFKDPTEGASITKVSNSDIQAGLQKGIDTWLGATMDLHGVGCVEAVERIGSFYSKFLCDEFNAGVRYIPTLMEDAARAGIKTLEYDASQLEIGDLIVWANNGDTQNHIGVYKGNGIAVDNSSGQDQIVERAVDRSWQRNEYIIKTGNGAGGGTPISRWDRGGDGLDSFALNSVTELLEQVKDYEEWYNNQEKLLEIEEKVTGDISEVGRKSTQNMEALLEATEDVNKLWQDYKRDSQNKIIDYLAKHPAVGEKIGGAENFFKISDTAKKELAKASKDKEFEKAVNNFIQAQENFEKSSNKLAKVDFDTRRKHGFMTADEKYNLKTHKLDRLLDTEDIDREDTISILQAKYRLATEELARLDKEYTELSIENQKEIDKAKEAVFDHEKERKRILAEYELDVAKLSTLNEKDRAKELEALNAKKEERLKKLDEEIKKKQEEISDRSNGTEKMREVDEQREKVQDDQKAIQKQLRDTEQAFRKAGANVAYDFFDKLLLQGKSLKDCLKDIVNEIAKIALKRLIFSAFGVKQSPLEQEGDLGMLLAGIGKKKKKGGSLIGSAVTDIIGGGAPTSGLFGGAFGSRRMAGGMMNFPVNFGFNQGSVFQGLMQPMQQMSQTMTGLTTGLATANSTMGMVNATNQVLNGTNQLTNTINTASRVATTVHTTATHSDASATRMNTSALQANTTALQTSASTMGLGGVGGGGGGGGLFGGFSILSGLIGALHTGGQIPRYATGGYTEGLIRGAGTGTSDSILTYLADRGQFIATSNGEYIIKKSTVDKLGVGFLDTLNNNPEAIGAMKGLKRYASGGNLGVSYSPSMSLKGIEGYKDFNKANMEKQTHFSTRKMEGLLQGLRDDVKEGNKGENTVTQPIILNTQADSATVMKAISKNPRALQAIMGKQNKRGFR